MREIDMKAAGSVWMESPVFAASNSQYSPSSRMDFGDAKSVGLALRRIGVKALVQPPDVEADRTFGVFCGQQPSGEWAVVTKAFDMSGISGGEMFDSLEELQRRWELD
jgi:hypothetical protein